MLWEKEGKPVIFGKYINRYYLRHAPVLLLGILALLMVDYIQLLVPQLYRLVINGVNLGQVVVRGETMPFTKEVLFQHICLPMIWIVLLMVVGRFLWRICFFGTSIRVQADLREKMFDHSRRLSQQYYQVNKVGNLMSLYTNDLDTIQECFGDGILMFFDALVLGLLALYRMWCMDRRMTMLALIPAAFMFAIGTVMGKTMTKTWEKRQQAFSDLSDFAQENFSGIAVIKAFCQGAQRAHRFPQTQQRQRRGQRGVYPHLSIARSNGDVLRGVGHLRHPRLRRLSCLQGRFQCGSAGGVHRLFRGDRLAHHAISMLIEKTSRGKASLNRITELLDAPIDVADRAGVPDLENPKGGIEFRDLTFRVPGRRVRCAENISFTIQPGESVGIVGKTGAGKTALVDLLLRTYNVPDGTFSWTGRTSTASPSTRCGRHVPMSRRRTSSSRIPSPTTLPLAWMTPPLRTLNGRPALLTSGTTLWTSRMATRLSWVSAASPSRAVRSSAFPSARALLKDAPILILDDSVSAVDTRTEKIILDNLKKSRAGKTTLLIAHRISTVERLDKIIFLEDGKVEAVGPHDQLYASCPEYRKMVDLQKLEDEVEVATHDESESASSRRRRHRHRVGAAAHRLRLRQRQENGYGLRAQHGRRRDPAPPLRLRQALPQAVRRRGLSRPLLHLLRHRVALIVGYIEELVVGDFELKSLYVSVAVYAGVLVFSMASTYLQAVILQRVGQRIISDLREDFSPTLKASPTAS